MRFLQRITQVLKAIGLPLFVCTLCLGSLDNLFSQQMHNEMQSAEGLNAAVWFYGLGSLVVSVLSPVVASLLVIYGDRLRDKVTLADFLHKFINAALIEQVRSLGKILSWSLLLIFPAFIKFLQLSFVTFVVALDPEYWRGSRDALIASTRTANRHLLSTSLWLLLLGLLPALLMTSLDEYQILWLHPLSAMFLYVIETLTTTALMLALLDIWQRSQKGAYYGADI